MLYLAEITKKKTGLIYSPKTELALLAYRQNYKNWSILSEPKTIIINEPCGFSEGTLVTANIIDEAKVIGKIEIAKSCVLQIMQENAKITEKFVKEQQTIKLWKQSLTYQFEELEKQKSHLEIIQAEIQHKEAKLKNINLHSYVTKNQIVDFKKTNTSRNFIGQNLQKANLISDAQLELALSTQSNYPELKIGSILVLRGWLKPETIDFFINQQQNLLDRQQKDPIGYYFKQAGLLNENQINLLLAEQEKINLRFGEVAILKGWLQRETVDYFLDALNQNNFNE